MSAPDNGGPAFPQMCADALDVGMVHAGMTLRDYFAGQAMRSILPIITEQWEQEGEVMGQSVARNAYSMADYMLAERQKGKPNG